MQQCLSIGLALAADVIAETVSGRIDVYLPEGVRVHRTSTIPPAGSWSEPRPPDTDCTIAARSGNGRIEISTR